MRVLGVVIVALAGCSDGGDLSDLEDFAAGVRARQEAGIGPLPSFHQPAPFAYGAAGTRSPFTPWTAPGNLSTRSKNAAIAPDFNRPRQRLEQHAIERISLVGSLSRTQVRHGLIRDADGAVHRVGVGDYLGEDHGRVRWVGPRSLELVEIVPDGADGWAARVRVLTREDLRRSREAD